MTLRVALRCDNGAIMITAGRHGLHGDPPLKQQVLVIHGAGAGAFDEDGVLVASLHHALGPAYTVRYPQLPEADSATYAAWKARLERAFAPLDDQGMLVGHAVGAAVLLTYLAAAQLHTPISALVLPATPLWGADACWTWDAACLAADRAAALARSPRIAVYHRRDDAVVPFAHLGLYTANLPQATIRALDGPGHQFGNAVTAVAEDRRWCNARRSEP